MIIPIGSDIPLRRPTLVTYALIGACVAAAISELIFGAANPARRDELRTLLALFPGQSGWWSWVTYAFLHGGFLHLAGNCVFLFVFGPPVEDRLGRVGFTALYVLGAIMAGVAEFLLRGAHPMIGASGSISAVAGAFLILFPRSGVRVFLFFIIIGVISIPAWVFILMHVAWDFLKLGTDAGNTAVGAHLGGYAFGAAIAAILLATGLVKREGLDILSLGRQASRRRAIKAATFAQANAKREMAERARKPDPKADAIAHARGQVLTKLGDADVSGAIESYKALLRQFGDQASACTLPRERQYEIANRLFERGDHQTAAIAYTRFLDLFPRDTEAPTVKLMLGLLNARYLNDPIAAKSMIHDALPALSDDGQKSLANQLLADLG